MESKTDEQQYLDLVQKVIEQGSLRLNERTGTGTKALFGVQCRYDLSNHKLPMFTTKQVSFKNVLNELIFFLLGKTNAKWLQERGCHIWDGNTTREFLDHRNLQDYPLGQLGPMYGAQWRHFGGDYLGADPATGDSMYGEDQGIDQIANLIHELKNNPESRRLLLTSLNPKDLSKSVLAPCHILVQFYVEDNQLSALMYQRSADLGLGVPYNVTSYALLTHIIAHLTGLQAKEFIHVMGDCHVYLNHVEALQEQCQRTPQPFPTLSIDAIFQDIDQIQASYFTVHNYQHQGKIYMKMAV